MKKNKKLPIALVIIAVAVLGIFMFTKGGGNIKNGFWSQPTLECWSDESHPAGEQYTPDEDEGTIASCCFDREGYQIDCNNPSVKLGAKRTLAIYGASGSPGVPGIFSVAHTIRITNTGSVAIDKAWLKGNFIAAPTQVWRQFIPPASWSNNANTAFLDNKYTRVLGENSVYAGPISVGNAIDFPTDVIDLQTIAGPPSSPYTYSLNLSAKATSYQGRINGSTTTGGQITVENEAVGFKVDFNWGV